LIKLEQLEDVPLAGAALSQVRGLYPDLEEFRVVHEIVRRLITQMVEDVIKTSVENLGRIKPESVHDVRECGETLVCFSEEMAKTEAAIKRFLFENVYREAKVTRIMNEAEQVLSDLFGYYFERPSEMPEEWQFGDDEGLLPVRARRVADYVAGMTDRFALLEHRRLFDVTPELR
jgi:dGTPase